MSSADYLLNTRIDTLVTDAVNLVPEALMSHKASCEAVELTKAPTGPASYHQLVSNTDMYNPHVNANRLTVAGVWLIAVVLLASLVCDR